ncbi:MAG: metal dependent phosphohydrolase [Firmicutes bacterium]|nr:metal dependent phosphohydrolase [Bacillota bacterium]
MLFAAGKKVVLSKWLSRKKVFQNKKVFSRFGHLKGELSRARVWPEVTGIKQVKLQNVKESMTLARDVINQYGNVLVNKGVQIRKEILVYLEKHKIDSVWIIAEKAGREAVNREITEVTSLITTATRRKMIQYLQNSFRKGNIVYNLTCLREAVEEAVQEISQQETLLIYLTETRQKADYLYGHCVDVGVFAIVLGMAMGLPREDICILGIGGLLHDYGKTTIHHSILEKEGSLTSDEFERVKTHASAGYNILRTETQVDHRIALMALQHHERPDGQGYPWGITQEKIDPLAKIVAVADVYDALTTDRVYRSAIAVYKAKKIISDGSGTQFDSQVVQALNRVAVPYYVGNSVMLNNGLAGAVLRINSQDPSRPIVWTREGSINLLTNQDVIITAVI